MVLDRSSGAIEHRVMCDIVRYIESGALMVFNDSRVRKARIFGVARDGGSQVEFLLLRRLGEGRWEAVASKLNRQRRGRLYDLPGGVCAESLGSAEAEKALRPDSIYLAFSPDIDDAYLERYGHVPLPPYIRREDVPEDEERYQTVYARETGSAACPTAGLHFTEEILRSLDAAGVRRVMVTLHVGLGTFLPVRTEEVEKHRLAPEAFEVPRSTAQAVNRARSCGKRAVAVGTTVTRALESCADESGTLNPGQGETGLFITPGHSFRAIDALITNFHLPRSTLLMLVAAWAGRDFILRAYEEAVRREYRFYSYGDAMLIL